MPGLTMPPNPHYAEKPDRAAIERRIRAIRRDSRRDHAATRRRGLLPAMRNAAAGLLVYAAGTCLGVIAQAR
jgi:hypothetical protein